MTPTPTAPTPSPTRTTSATTTPSTTPSATPSYTPSWTPTPSPTYTPTYTYTYTYTRTPTYRWPSVTPTCYDENYCTPTDTPTYTPTPTVTLTPTPPCKIQVSKVGGYPALLANKGGQGGIGNFEVSSSGLQDTDTFTLKLVPVAGSGSATFVDNGANVMMLTGNVDQIVKVQGGAQSSQAQNMELQAYCPDGTLASKTKFTVFWTVGSGQYKNPVPDDAINADNVPLSTLVKRFRKDNQNELGWALGWTDNKRTKEASRGHMLARFQVQPDGIPPGDLRRDGPDDGFNSVRLRTSRYYFDGCVEAIDGTVTNQKESSAANATDLTADPDAAKHLVIYDWDAPSHPKLVPGRDFGDPQLDHDYRIRANFNQWATYEDDDGNVLRASENFNWYWRAAWHWDATKGETRAEGAPGDNEVGPEKTPLTWNLEPSKEKDMRIDGFTPGQENNTKTPGFVVMFINGDFPLPDDGSCPRWVVYILSTPGDSSGDPADVPEDIVIRAERVGWRPDGKQLRALIPLNNAAGAAPAPAGTYQVHVVHGDKDVVAKQPFEVTENPMARWVLEYYGQLGLGGDKLLVGVASEDAFGNRVTRRGKTPPRMFWEAGVNVTSPFPQVYGKYGFYTGVTTRVPPGVRGRLTFGVGTEEPVNYFEIMLK